jgi:hypothetical protein
MRDSTDSFWELVESGDVKHMHTSGFAGIRNTWHSPPTWNLERFQSITRKLRELKYAGFLTVEMHTKYHSLDQFKKEMTAFSQA